jgi:nucleoside-diphosphate-sugar epimerase
VDGYTQTKVESERLVLQYQRDHKLPAVVLRPGFIYGPRDRTVLPRIVDNLKAGRVVYFDGGRHALNTIYVGNLVDAILLAIERPNAVGQIFNLTDGETISKRQFFETVADGLGLPRPKRALPLFLGKLAARFMERRALRRKSPTAPRLTRAGLKFLGFNLDFGITKARTELGYQPRVAFAEGMKAMLDWHRATHAEPAG